VLTKIQVIDIAFSLRTQAIKATMRTIYRQSSIHKLPVELRWQ